MSNAQGPPKNSRKFAQFALKLCAHLCPSVVKFPSDFMDSAFPPAGNLLADFYLFIRVFVRLVGVVHGLLVEHKKSPNLVLSSRGQNNRTLRETRPGD